MLIKDAKPNAFQSGQDTKGSRNLLFKPLKTADLSKEYLSTSVYLIPTYVRNNAGVFDSRRHSWLGSSFGRLDVQFFHDFLHVYKTQGCNSRQQTRITHRLHASGTTCIKVWLCCRVGSRSRSSCLWLLGLN